MDTINLKKVRPIFNGILITANIEELAEPQIGKIINPDAIRRSVKLVQTVVAVGESVRAVKPGDVVYMNYDRYAVRKYKDENNGLKEEMAEFYKMGIIAYQFNEIIIDGVPHLLVFENDVRFIVEEMEEIKPSVIIQPSPTLIL